MSKEGKLIEHIDPKPTIRKNAENAHDWEYAEEAKDLYDMAVLFKNRFLDPILHTDRGRLPDPVISFDDLRNKRTLAAYTLHRNAQGLLDEITFNTAHYQNEDDKKVWVWGGWAQAETLLHEQIHLWQENFGKNKHKPGRIAHDKEFVEKCESLGLHPMPVVGCHMEVADGVFAQLMAELGIPRPEDVPRDEGEKPTKRDWFRPGKEKGTSTLKKWVCPECGLKVRMGINGNPELIHHPCTEKKGEKVFLVKDDGLTHVIYEGDDKEGPLDIPRVIEQLNKNLKAGMPSDAETTTVESIALKLGINRSTLYRWVRSDQEFSQTLERLKTVQENDPFKTGTAEDSRVNSMMIALLLMEKAKSSSSEHS